MLCMHCYRQIGIAYNELCFQCYKRIGRMPPGKAAKRAQSGEFGKEMQIPSNGSRAVSA